MVRVSLLALLFVVLLNSQSEAYGHVGHTHSKIVSTRRDWILEDEVQNELLMDGRLEDDIIIEEVFEHMGNYRNYDDSERYDCGNNLFADYATEAIFTRLEKKPNTNIAKNVIIFVAENTPLSAVRQARKYSNVKCHNKMYPGNQCLLQKHFYDIALVKTECFDGVEANPACSATALFAGVKANSNTIGVSPEMNHCPNQFEHSYDYKLPSIAAWAQNSGKRTGLVTTSPVTSASVAPLYAHTCNGFWESDADLPYHHGHFRNADVAAQLMHSETGKNLNVILGGGRSNFLPFNKEGGSRLDRRNLVKDWARSKRSAGEYAYIETVDELWEVCRYTDYILGLFNDGALNACEDPSIADLTEVAIKLLHRPHEEEGYVLFVQHANPRVFGNELDAAEAQIDNTIEIIKAVRVAIDQTSEEDTLIIFTSDYAARNPDIAEIYDENVSSTSEGTSSDTSYDSSFRFSSSSKSSYESDSYSSLEDIPSVGKCDIRETGEDAFLFARGPWSHLFGSVIEQYWIPHFAAFASCIGEGAQVCDLA